MGETERRISNFVRLLQSSEESVADTLTLFNEPAPSGMKKVEWKEVINAAEGVSRHATTAGILWKGKVGKKEGMENISSYIQAIQGFLLTSHGSTTGAGPTLFLSIEHVSKQLARSSLSLIKAAISGSKSTTSDVNLPLLVGRVWEACEAVRKAPPSNRVAIGRSLTQVAVSVKDVIRELGDFQQSDSMRSFSDATNVNLDMTRSSSENHELLFSNEGEPESSDESSELCNNLSAEEMQMVESVKDLGSALLGLIKQLLHIVAGTSKNTDNQIADAEAATILERILELSKALGVGMDELGASLYPPQEIDVLQRTVAQVESLIEHLQIAVGSLFGLIPESFLVGLNAYKDASISLNKILEARVQESNK